MELQNHLFSVSELNNVIKNVLESSFYSINIEGELSNFRPSASGHWYFSLKDRESSISAVMFKNSTYNVNFKPTDGMKIKIKGKVTLYSQRGTYQIVCTDLTLFGEGEILLMLEERKRRLASLGLFDPSKKQLLPRFPKTIGIITSPTGAALQDILKVLNRRHCLSNIVILPSVVQGLNAHKTINEMIIKANRNMLCDLIILARGGGSIEDLLPFSEESLVIEIGKSKIPIITGIGHEIDTSLSDYAADVRAATPSAAAEIVTEGSDQLFTTIKTLKSELINSINIKIRSVKETLRFFDKSSVKRHLESKISNSRMSIDNIHNLLITTMNNKFITDKNRIIVAKKSLYDLSPKNLFDKGYAWVTKDNKNINNSSVSLGDIVEINYINGKISSEIKDIK